MSLDRASESSRRDTGSSGTAEKGVRSIRVGVKSSILGHCGEALSQRHAFHPRFARFRATGAKSSTQGPRSKNLKTGKKSPDEKGISLDL